LSQLYEFTSNALPPNRIRQLQLPHLDLPKLNQVYRTLSRQGAYQAQSHVRLPDLIAAITIKSSIILCINLIRRVTHVDDLVKAQYIHFLSIIYCVKNIFILFWSIRYMTLKFCCIFMLCCITTLRSHHHSCSLKIQVNLNTSVRFNLCCQSMESKIGWSDSDLRIRKKCNCHHNASTKLSG